MVDTLDIANQHSDFVPEVSELRRRFLQIDDVLKANVEHSEW